MLSPPVLALQRIATATASAACAALVFTAAATATPDSNVFDRREQAQPGFFKSIDSLLETNPSRLRYGVSILDIDGDGIFEAFVCGYGESNSLLKWQGGRLRDVAGRMGIAAPERRAIGVASCDMDGDGDEEIYVLNTDSYSGDKAFSDHLFKRSQPGRAFRDVMDDDVNRASRSSFAGRSVACVDRTGGGRYEVAAASYGRPLLLYQMVDAARGAVQDVAQQAGFVGVTGGRGITGGPLYPGKDYSTTPGMDLYLDNERGPSFFFRNDGAGTFAEVAGSLGLADAANNGRGVALLDADGDGRLDIVTGNWMGQHRLWLAPARGERDVRFHDAAPAAMAEPSAIRTVVVADFDNDGYEEIFFNNICSCRHDMPTMCSEPNRLFSTRDGKTWEAVPIGSAAEQFGRGTGAAAYDADGDGLLELLVSHGENRAEPLSLHRVADEASARRNHYLRILPRTKGGAPARGALVTLKEKSGREQLRVLDPGSGYLCQGEPVAHFGLGAATEIESVTVTWPGGEERVLRGLDVDKQHVVPL